MLTPEQFAEVLCDDLDLPSNSFAGPIAQSIRQQCEQFSTDMIPEDEEDRRVIIKVGRKALRTQISLLPNELKLTACFFLYYIVIIICNILTC